MNYKNKIPHLYKSTTIKFATISKAILVALVGASNQVQDAFVRWWGLDQADASLLMLVIGAVVGAIGLVGESKGYMDTNSKPFVEHRQTE